VPSASEIKEQVARETERRTRLAVPAFAGGILYLLSGITTTATLNGAPTVGLLQGLAPALAGEANPAKSPRAQEVEFISHHSYPLIAGSVMASLAIAALTLVLLVLVDAARFRRPTMWAAARPMILAGGIALVIVSIGHQVVAAIETHNFATGNDFSNHAVDNALTKSTPNVVTAYLSLLAGLAVAVGMIVIVVNAMRAGLVTRWMGVLGIFTGILLFLPIGGATLQVVPAFWLVAMGILYIGNRRPGSRARLAHGHRARRCAPKRAEGRVSRRSPRGPETSRPHRLDPPPAAPRASAGASAARAAEER